ncbi:MAG: DHH family phosphoesterase [Clostridia bacterium]|nr:DHH family phosphoesterase [Clostridia bacterium]
MSNLKKRKWLDLKIFSVRIFILSVIIILATIVSIVKPITLYVDLSIILITSLLCIYVCITEIRGRKYRIDEISKSLDIVLKDSFSLIDIPMVMLTDKNKMIWQNNASNHILPKDIIEETAQKLSKQKRHTEVTSVTINIGNGEVYSAVGNNIKFDDTDCLLISFINRTYETNLKKTLEDTRVSVGVIFVDNYEETMQGLDDVKKAEITSMIEKELRNFASENKGVIAKVDKDKFILFVEKQYAESMEEGTFAILERVRNITNITKLPITVSIGMSYSEDTLEERYKSSSSALDIALGRGGDQAVIKKDKKFEFFGGSNLGLEKTSRVRARTISQALKEVMEKSDNIYIMGHKNTDIDCIGAAIGVYKIANSLNKNAKIVTDAKCNSSTKTLINKLKENDEYENVFITSSDLKKTEITNNDFIVVVDTHKKSYLAYPDFLDEFEKIAVIDHHRRGPEFIDYALLTYHEIYASSASELVTELLMYSDHIVLTPVEAECLYAGIVMDTKNFMFKTGVRTFEVAAYLKKFGIDVAEVKQLFQNDFETYIAKVDIVKNAEIIKGKIAVSSCEEKHEDMPIIAAQAADELLSISGIIASFVLCKVDNIVMISGRSMGDINVQLILEKIGGGGHLTFAGAQIAGITIEEAREKLLESINDYFNKE